MVRCGRTPYVNSGKLLAHCITAVHAITSAAVSNYPILASTCTYEYYILVGYPIQPYGRTIRYSVSFHGRYRRSLSAIPDRYWYRIILYQVY